MDLIPSIKRKLHQALVVLGSYDIDENGNSNTILESEFENMEENKDCDTPSEDVENAKDQEKGTNGAACDSQLKEWRQQVDAELDKYLVQCIESGERIVKKGDIFSLLAEKHMELDNIQLYNDNLEQELKRSFWEMHKCSRQMQLTKEAVNTVIDFLADINSKVDLLEKNFDAQNRCCYHESVIDELLHEKSELQAKTSEEELK